MILHDFEKSDITVAVSKYFDLKVDKVDNSPSGFNSKTFTIYVGDQKYFLKVVENAKFQEIARGLPLLEELYHRATRKVNCPVRNKDGGFKIIIDQKHTGILYTHLEGEWVFEGYDRDKLADIISKVHLYTPSNTGGVLTEEFDNEILHKFRDTVSRLEKVEKEDHFTEYYAVCEPKYLKVVNSFEALSDKISFNTDHITHGDSWGNVVMSPDGDVYLMDWDEIKMAPIERDLWLWEVDGSRDFVEVYRKRVQNYSPDPDLLLYYTYLRYIEDVEGWIDTYLKDPNNDAEMVRQLKQDTEEWLDKLI